MVAASSGRRLAAPRGRSLPFPFAMQAVKLSKVEAEQGGAAAAVRSAYRRAALMVPDEVPFDVRRDDAGSHGAWKRRLGLSGTFRWRECIGFAQLPWRDLQPWFVLATLQLGLSAHAVGAEAEGGAGAARVPA